MDTNWVSYTSDIIVGISAISVAIIAFLGLRTWRKELIGKAKFEAAHNVLLLARKVTNNFTHARGLLTLSDEWSDRVRDEGETKEVTSVLDLHHARSKRLQPLSENLQGLQQAAWEAEIVLGKDADSNLSEVIKEYISLWVELSNDVSEYFNAKYEAAFHNSKADQEFLTKLSKTIFGLVTDDFGKRVQNAEDKLSSILKDYVK